MKVLITGASGFIGSNLIARLNELKVDYLAINREDDIFDHDLAEIDFIFHLAGINRPEEDSEFDQNEIITEKLCKLILSSGKKIPIIYTSSIQSKRENPYGVSKRKSEDVLNRLHKENNSTVMIYRLTNVFGKWCKPNYNSVVATFCHNVLNNLPLVIHDEEAIIRLVYIDDVVDDFIEKMSYKKFDNRLSFPTIETTYEVSIGDLATKISNFASVSENITVPRTGDGFDRALYATYLSYMKPEDFSYSLQSHNDDRGRFVEMIKTIDSGQISYFTAGLGIKRGDHYHHTKNEQFLVIQGEAVFRFRNIRTDEIFEKKVSSSLPEIVQTIPGWNHDITNIGDEELIVILWSNEAFNPKKPDTFIDTKGAD